MPPILERSYVVDILLSFVRGPLKLEERLTPVGTSPVAAPGQPKFIKEDIEKHTSRPIRCAMVLYTSANAPKELKKRLLHPCLGHLELANRRERCFAL
jgi:hypothetical protein